MSPAAVEIKTLQIDGRDVGARADQTILEVARENGINIPTLCHLDGLSDVGACRLCLVEVEGSNKLLPACVTRVQEGMEVTAHSPRLEATAEDDRRDAVRRAQPRLLGLRVERSLRTAGAWPKSLGITHVRVPYLYPKLQVDASNRRFVVDHNRCILCTRCVRVCDEIEGAHTWDRDGARHRLPRHH